MIDYLRSIFGGSIAVSDYLYPSGTPMFIKDGYTAQLLVWNGNSCLLLAPADPSLRLPALKKQLLAFQRICDCPCALFLRKMTALQRRNLIESNIPFVCELQQVYLPFWGCLFSERFGSEAAVGEKMSPGTQLVFLYLYYLQSDGRLNQTQIAEDLRLSKATCSRAVRDLAACELIVRQSEGRVNWVAPAYGKAEFLQKGYARLRSPVERRIYVKTAAEGVGFPKSGLTALAELSMIGVTERDGAAAMSRRESLLIPAGSIVSENEFADFGGFVIEVWGYDPGLLSIGGRVDDISLLLSLEESGSERVQAGLDEIRERHALPVSPAE